MRSAQVAHCQRFDGAMYDRIEAAVSCSIFEPRFVLGSSKILAIRRDAQFES